MPLEIREIKTTRELKAFIQFPHRLYRGNPYWVPNLVSDDMNALHWKKNPAFEHCEARYWMAFKDGQPAGRIAAIWNPLYIEKWKSRRMRFGWIEFIDDPAVSSALLEKVETWAREKGMSAVHGPLGFTDLDREGMLVEGFDELGTLATMYNHPYYPDHMERAGYTKDVDWVEYEITLPEDGIETIARVARAAMRRSRVRIKRARSKKELLGYIDQLFDILDETYRDLYSVVPLTRAQEKAYTKQYFDFVSPDFVPMVVDENDRMIAFGLVMPSMSRALQKSRGRIFPFGFVHLLRAMKNNERADLYLIAVKPEYQGKGINAVIMNHMLGVFQERGIRVAESNPELETNHLVQSQWKHFKTRQHKRRRCYIRELG